MLEKLIIGGMVVVRRQGRASRLELGPESAHSQDLYALNLYRNEKSGIGDLRLDSDL